MNQLYKLAALQVLLVLSSDLFAQQITVLSGNNNYSLQSGPQGGLRTQRQFYLIRPGEMKASGIPGGTSVNKIGFTIGVAQNINTKGAFKVWLRNTDDEISMIDSSWKESITNTNTFSGRFFPGEYEVQVIPMANCLIVADTAKISFSNRNLAACQPPTGLKSTNITANSATFNWTAPANTPLQYKLMYKSIDVSVWTTVTTGSTSYNVTGLSQNKSYEWRVGSDCSGDSSEMAVTSFTTLIASQCNPPTALAVLRLETSGADTLAVLKWNAAAGAIYYSINYRRAGTANWLTTLSFTDSIVIRKLVSGSIYEWQVKTNCSDGSGDFKSGANFTTLGTTRCFAPSGMSVNALTDSTAVFTWNVYPGVSSHKIRYRLKGTLKWTDAINGMTLVHNDSLNIPPTTGFVSVSFNLGSPFTYTANSGLYVAYEYSRLTGPISSQNISVSTTADTVLKQVNGLDSIKYALSFSSRSDSGRILQDSVLTRSDYRPETILGASSVGDSVAVLAVWTLGKTAPRFQDSIYVNAQLSNRTNANKRYGVKLTIREQQTNTLRYIKTDSITVRGFTDTLIRFYLKSNQILENDSVRVSIDPQAGENVVNNNSKTFLQSVNSYILAYADATTPIKQVGFNTLPGLLLTKYTMKGCGKVIAAQVFLTSSAKGHPVYAVIRNSAGMITRSSTFTPDASQTNKYHSFYFNTPVSFQNEDFYIGLAQPASATPYQPVGAQWENSVNRAGAFYKANLDGTGLVDSSGLGRLMCRAEIIPSSPQPFIDGASNNIVYLCSGGTRLLSAGSMEQRFADSVISFSSQNSAPGYQAIQALGTPDVFPATGTITGGWLSEQPDSTQPNKHEYLALRFPDPSPINFVDIYETAGPGAVDTVWVKNSITLNYDTVFTRIPDSGLPNVARKYRVTFPLTPNPVSEIKISLNSGRIAGYNAIDAVAIGKYAVPATFSNYSWSGPGIVGASNTQSITIDATGTYKVNLTTATGCAESSDSVIVQNVPASVSISPIGPVSFCSGDSIWLKSSIRGGNTWSTGATTDSIAVKTTGSYTVSNNAGSDCGVLISAPVVVNVNFLPVVAISGILGICQGGTTTLDAGLEYSSYRWSNGSTGRYLTVASAGTWSVTVTNANGCKGSASATTTIIPDLIPVITGSLNFCQGTTTILDAGSGYSSYLWSTGATTRTINVTTEDAFTVTVTNINGCSGSTSVYTSFLSAPSPSISGGSSFCPGGVVILTANEGYTSYLWSTGATTSTVSVNSANTYTVTVTADNGCTGSASKIITQAPPLTPIISGTLSFCGGSTTTLDAGVGYESYLWSTGSTSRSILVSTAGTFEVTVTTANGCSGLASATTTATGSVPVTPGLILGNTSGICGSSGNVYTISPVPNASFYVWTVPAGATITSGQSTTSITVSYTNAFTTGNIVVAASNACGQSPSLNPRILTIQGAPALPGPISGPVTGLCQQTGIVYSIAAVNGATFYTWTVPAGVTIDNGQGSTSITVSFNNTFSTGNISVVASNTCGVSAPVSLMVQGAPAVPGVITGQARGVCGQTGKVFSIAAVNGASTYTWTVPAGATITAGQGTVAITVSFANNFGSGNICVKANNTCGSSAINCLAVAGLPAVPGSIFGATMVCYNQNNVAYSVAAVPGTTTYTWTVPSRAKITSGQGTPNIIVKFASTSGNITVKTKNGCGTSAVQTLAVTSALCPIASKSQVDITGNDKSESVMNIRVFPNPSDGMINIDIENGIPGKYEVQLTNSIGQVVYMKDILWSGNIIHVTNLHVATGIYNVKVFNKQFIKNIKLMIQ